MSLLHRVSLRLSIIISLSPLLACTGQKSADKTDSYQNIEFISPADSLSLPLPTPPANLSTTEERADFVALHFWDKMDFGNSNLINDEAFIEQNFSNFISIFHSASSSGLQSAVSKLIASASEHPEAFSTIMELADKYLRDPNSPMHFEKGYICFLKAALQNPKAAPEQKEQWNYRLKRALMNAQGTHATDFPVVTADGKRTNILSIDSSTPTRIIFFYDLDCESCSASIAKLRENKNLNDDIRAGKTAVIAVNTTSHDIADLKNKKIPTNWINVMPDLPADGGKTIDDLYDLPALPSIYFLSPDNIITEKDPPLSL